DIAFSVQQTLDSGFVLCGYTNSFGAGGYDAYLVKTDPAGNLQWEKTFGGSDWDFAYWAEQTKDGGYILAGETYSFGKNNQAYVVKTDSAGNLKWQNNFGDTLDEAAKEVHQTSDGGFVFAGYTGSYGTGDDFYLLKTDSSGSQKWMKHFDNSTDDKCNSFAICTDGSFALGGYTMAGIQKKNYFVQTDSLGNFITSKIDTPSIGNKEIYRIRVNKEGNYYTVGWTDAITASSKEIFFATWNNGFWYLSGGSAPGGFADEEGYGIVQAPDSGYVMVGYTSTFGTGPDNVLLVKTDKTLHYNSTINSYVSTTDLAIENNGMTIYPNPFRDQLNIQLDEQKFAGIKKIKITLSDIEGREILNEEKQISSSAIQTLTLNLAGAKFTPGLYILSVYSENLNLHQKLMFAR
ncbi:MAG TPA: T9SS type A sorting domain-containing protein, partial [Bacteroidia bacterium]